MDFFIFLFWLLFWLLTTILSIQYIVVGYICMIQSVNGGITNETLKNLLPLYWLLYIPYIMEQID